MSLSDNNASEEVLNCARESVVMVEAVINNDVSGFSLKKFVGLEVL